MCTATAAAALASTSSTAPKLGPNTPHESRVAVCTSEHVAQLLEDAPCRCTRTGSCVSALAACSTATNRFIPAARERVQSHHHAIRTLG